jgi:DNA repair photolyase
MDSGQENALELLVKKRKKPLTDKTIYMSSVTDPYQPIEKDLELTRALLEELLAYHQVRLVVQTRGPLVTRDIDLLKQFPFAQVNMTITTDDDEVRRVFEPHCASTQRRLDAIRQIRDVGIQACITMTPLLPVRDPDEFASKLLATGVERFVVHAFHATRSRFVAGTGQAALELSEKMGWTPARYAEVVKILRQRLPELREGKIGFSPDWLDA